MTSWLNCVICYYKNFVKVNVDNVDKVMNLLVLSNPCFINSRLFDLLEKDKHKFAIAAQKNNGGQRTWVLLVFLLKIYCGYITKTTIFKVHRY